MALNGLPKTFMLTDRELVDKVFSDLEFYHEFKDSPEPQTGAKSENQSPANWTKTCATCKVEFDDLQEQRQHFKLDWHRYNLKQKLSGNPGRTVNEEQFNNLIDSLARKSESKSVDNPCENDDDIESLSGSDSEEEEGEEDSDDRDLRDHFLRQPKLYLINSKTDDVFSLHRTLVHPGKGELEG